MNRLKAMLMSEWDLMRVVRLAIGIWLGIEAVMQMEVFAGLASAFFLYQAVTGTGCCGVQGCYTPPRRQTGPNKVQDIEYEEVN
jgi:hypothetical protein